MGPNSIGSPFLIQRMLALPLRSQSQPARSVGRKLILSSQAGVGGWGGGEGFLLLFGGLRFMCNVRVVVLLFARGKLNLLGSSGLLMALSKEVKISRSSQQRCPGRGKSDGCWEAGRRAGGSGF